MNNNVITTENELRQAIANIFSELVDALRARSAESAAPAKKAPFLFEAQKTSDRLTTEWPKLSIIPPEQTIAELAAVNDQFVPGATAFLYVAGSTGLADLARQLQLPLFKIGLTQQSDLLVRQRDLCVDRYAGSFKSDHGYVQADGFGDWELRQMERLSAPLEPIVTAMPRTVRILLPNTMTFDQFEKEFDEFIAPISLASWIQTSVGRRHLESLPIDPAIADRFTAYEFGSSTRHSRAAELFICRPRDDVRTIASHVVRIIHRHLLTVAA